MTFLADSHGCFFVQETNFYITTRVVAQVTAHASRSVFINCLPAGEENMKVIVEVLFLSDICMAL